MLYGPLALQARQCFWNAEGDGGAGGQGEPADGGDDTPKTYTQEDIDKLQGALNSERSQRKDFEGKFKTSDAELKKLQSVGMSDLERITGERDTFKTELDTIRTELRTMRGKDAVVAAASDALSPSAVWALAASDLDYGDDGTPTNVDAVVAAIRKREPKLFGEIVQGSADGGAGGPSTGGKTDMNAFIRGEA